MKQIYELRKSGESWKEIKDLISTEITESGLNHKLKRWIKANNLEPLGDGRKVNSGRKSKEIKLK